MNNFLEYKERKQRLIAQYGEILSVKEIAEVFKYSSPSSVRKAHELGHLPVKLKKFPERRGQYATASSVAHAIGWLDDEELEDISDDKRA